MHTKRSEKLVKNIRRLETGILKLNDTNGKVLAMEQVRTIPSPSSSSPSSSSSSSCLLPDGGVA